MIRKTARETVLYYNPEASSKVMKLKGVLVRMGIRIRNVTPEQFDEAVGRLVGISGFEKEKQNMLQSTGSLQRQNQGQEEQQEQQNQGEGQQKNLQQNPEWNSEQNFEQQQQPRLMTIPEEMLVMHGFTSRRIDELLAAFRKAGVSKVELKAVVTETNVGWTFYHLYEEIKKEHERMMKGEADAEE